MIPGDDDPRNALAREVAEELLHSCAASRVTVRLDSEAEFFPVVAEARSSGVGSVSGVQRASLEKMATFRYVADQRQTLVQNDCLDSEIETPAEVVGTYGVRAQVLVPIVNDGTFKGAISIHETRGPRDWTEEEVASAETAAARLASLTTTAEAEQQ
jgi:maleate isomerase